MSSFDDILKIINNGRQDSLSHNDLILNIVTYNMYCGNYNILTPLYKNGLENKEVLKKNYTDMYLPENYIIVRISQYNILPFYNAYKNINELSMAYECNFNNEHYNIEQRLNVNIPFKYFFILKQNINTIIAKLMKSIKATISYNLTDNIIMFNSVCNGGLSEYNKITSKFNTYLKSINSTILYLPLPYRDNLSLYIIQNINVTSLTL